MWWLEINEQHHGYIVHLCSRCAEPLSSQLVGPKPEKENSPMIGQPCRRCGKPIDR